VDAAKHRLLVRQTGFISVVNTETDTVDQAAIPTLPEAGLPPLTRMAYNPATDRLFALANELDSGRVVIGIYDPTTKEQVGVIGSSQDLSGQLQIDLSDIVVNPLTNRIYVAGGIPSDAEGDGLALYAFDGTSRAFLGAIVSPQAELGRPVFANARMVVNVAQNRVYAATLTQDGVTPYLLSVRASAGLAEVAGLSGTNPSLAFSETGQRLYVGATAETGEVGTPTNAQVRIFDEPLSAGTLQFTATKFTAPEGGPAAIITVQRVGGDYGSVSVQYTTADGTAVAGQDYSAASGTLTWDTGDLADKTFTVPVIDDTELEAQETVLLTLSAPTGNAELGSAAKALLVIADNETSPVLAPKIVSAASAAGEVARPLTYAIRATRVPRSYAASGLPAGLTLNTRNGVIRGTPTLAGTYYVTLKATNPYGTGVATLVLNIGIETRPDLTPTLTSVTVTHTAAGGLIITGFAKIANAGTRASTAARTQMYVSSDAVYDSTDAALAGLAVVTGVPAPFRSAVPALAKGASYGPKPFRISVAPSRAASVTGKYLLLVVDGAGVVKELDDTNNAANAGPL
jgi:hypothetical protein